MDKKFFSSPLGMLAVRPRQADGLYSLGEEGRAAFDAVKTESKADVKTMTVSCTITTQSEDSRGDVIVTNGIDLSDHEKNPVVLYNHGYGMELPIGKAVGTDGKYSCRKDMNRIKAVTKFSENLLEAEQVFSLIEEGILNGVSVGVNLLEAEWREDALKKNGWPTLMIHRSRLFEYSHTPCPINAEALVEKVRKGMICGKGIPKSLLDSFQPWVPEAKPVVTSGFDAEAFKASLKAEIVEEIRKAVKATEPPAPTVPPASDTTPASVTPITVTEPAGASVLRGVYDRLMELSAFVEDMSPREMNPRVQEAVEESAASLEACCARLADIHRAEYPHLDSLCPDQGDEGPRYTEAMERLKARVKAAKVAIDAALETRRRLTATAKSQCSDAAAFLKEVGQTLPAGKRDQAMVHAASLESVGKSQPLEVTAEKYLDLQRAYDALKAKAEETATMHERLVKEFRKAKRGF